MKPLNRSAFAAIALALLPVSASLVPSAALAAAKAEPKSDQKAAPKISVRFRGPLKDGLRELASKGGINLVVTGDLDQSCEIYLTDVTAEEALATVGSAYNLKTNRQGSIWTLRPMTPQELATQPPSTGDDKSSDEDAEDTSAKGQAPSAVIVPTPSAPLVAPVPPMPATPTPPAPPAAVAGSSTDADADEASDEADAAKDSRMAKLQEKLAKKLERRLAAKLGKSGNREVFSTGPVTIESGNVVKNAVAYGGPLRVKSGAVVEDDAVSFGGDVIVESGAVIQGDAVSFGGQVKKEEGALIEGDEVAMNGLGAGILGKRHLSGKKKLVDHGGDDEGDDASGKIQARASGFPGFFLRFALLFGLGFAALMFAPERMKLLDEELRRDPVKCGVAGIVGGISLIPLTLGLVLTIVGILVVPFLWALAVLGAAMGTAVIASNIGLKLPVLRGRKSQAVVLALGLLLILAVAQIPVLGALVTIALVAVSLGAVIRTRFGQPPKGFPTPEPTPTASAT